MQAYTVGMGNEQRNVRVVLMVWCAGGLPDIFPLPGQLPQHRLSGDVQLGLLRLCHMGTPGDTNLLQRTPHPRAATCLRAAAAAHSLRCQEGREHERAHLDLHHHCRPLRHVRYAR